MLNLTNKLQKKINENATNALRALIKRFDAGNAQHELKMILTSENLEDAIERAVKNLNIDLVVMGTKGASGLKEFFFGSNTVHIIKRMRLCPILIVPDKYKFVKPRQIAFPTDFNRFYDANELTILTDITSTHKCKIRIVHYYDEENLEDIQEYNLATLKQYLGDYEYSVHCVPNYTKKATEINEFINELGIDILAMVNYRHGFIEHFIKEPVIKNIGYKPVVPLLVMPEFADIHKSREMVTGSLNYN
jgi:nucleotide-binding universal stress UspA family protein